MTTVAAVQGPSWAVIGADSQVSEDSKKYRLPQGFSKLIHNDVYLIGVAGDHRAVNVLTYNFAPPSPGRFQGADLDEFMVSKFVPSLKRCFDNNFYGKDSEHGSSLIVLVRGVAFEVGSDYDCIRDENGLYSIGSGSSYAIGALHATDTNKVRTLGAAKDMIRSALLASCSYDSGTSEPVTIVVQQQSK